MKLFFTLLAIFTFQNDSFAKDFTLAKARATYTVKHLLKTVMGESTDLRGKMVCENQICEFLVAIPAKSFVSSDSNRDLNMQTILEVTKYPVITVKGKIAEGELAKQKFDLDALINFHGIERSYKLKIDRSTQLSGQFSVLLEEHKVERPSLLMAKIENEVPLSFSFDWKE